MSIRPILPTGSLLRRILPTVLAIWVLLWQTVPAGAADPSLPDNTHPASKPVVIINMGISNQGQAQLFCLDFNRKFVPQLQTLDEGNPRVFFDVYGIEQWDGQTAYPVNGTIIQTIRTGFHQAERKLRIVMDLSSRYNYNVSPSYDERYNLFCVAYTIGGIRKQNTQNATSEAAPDGKPNMDSDTDSTLDSGIGSDASSGIDPSN